MARLRWAFIALIVVACTDGGPTLPLAGSTHSSAELVGPTLLINEFHADPAAVSDDTGEWFEIHNRGSSAVNLRDYVIASGNDSPHRVASDVTVAAGGYAVLARSGLKKRNGGVNVAYQYGSVITLANSGDWIALRDLSGNTVDSVAYTGTSAGKAWGVEDPSADNTLVTDGNWVLQSSAFGKGDLGTPGARNDGFVTPPGPIVSVVVSPATASIAVTASQTFTAAAYDANGTSVASTFTWSSSDVTVATVDAAGTATGVAAGSSTITATAENGVSGSGALTVTAESGGGGGAELVVQFLDVGQGDATYIQNGTSRIVIDGGPSTSRFGALLDSLQLNNTTIDVVILSHEHFDHLSGLRELFRTSRNITIKYVFENKNAYSTVSLAELRDSIRARESRGELLYRDTDDPCANGQPICTVFLNGGAKLHVMRPDPDGSSANNRSAPVKLVGPDSASFSMWFAGDAEHEAINWFLGAANYDVNPGMRVNVVKGNHHGSCNGITSAYAAALSPDWVTFGVGASNTYGHVHAQTKNLWASLGRPWYRTDENGTITIRTPGTAGGGYSIEGQRGLASRSGQGDGSSSQSACNPLP